MRVKVFVSACFGLLLLACADREPASAASVQKAAPSEDVPAASVPAQPAPGRPRYRIDLPASAPAGPPGPLSAQTLALTPATIERAIVRELGDAASGIDVSVDRGIVRLSGDVRTEVDFQRANYVARAIDGVIEVDQRDMRVAR